jgi:uncharacterized protein
MRLPARLSVAAMLAACIAAAVDFAALQPQGHVSDFAGAIDSRSRTEIEEYCAQVQRATGAEIAVITLDTLQGEPIEDVANSIFRRWGIGQKGANEGVLLLLATGDRRARLEVGYGLEPLLPDGFAGGLLRQMRPALRNQSYGDAIAIGVHEIGSRIAQAKGVALQQKPELPQRRQRHKEPIPFGMILAGAVILFVLLGMGGRSRPRGPFGGGGFGGGLGGWLPGIVLGNMMGRGFGGRGGGGFGGYDSGGGFGGFGGFGGGDSGGGGASSDW